MTVPLLEQLKETVGDMTNVQPEKFEALIQETIKVLKTIQEKVQSKDEKLKEEGIKMALELKEGIEKQAEELCKVAGLDILQLDQMFEKEILFMPEDQKQILKNTQKEFDDFKQHVLFDGKEVPKREAPLAPKMKKKRSASRLGTLV